jgi:L-alanine-DL-glutamate epimerase-like enolase superfamily enzyme
LTMPTDTQLALQTNIPVEEIKVSAFRVPTDFPESDGTLKWDKTTMVLVEVSAAGLTGIGYTYADVAAATLIEHSLVKLVESQNAMLVPRIWQNLKEHTRNLGHGSLVAMAISAIDCALWDLKARLLNLPLATLLGAVRDSVPIYGSGGFTSYSNRQLEGQLGGWVSEGIPRVKMKIGRDARTDIERVRAARSAIGNSTELFVDANGAYSTKQALEQAELFQEQNVTWFEEPVSADDLADLHLIRHRAPAGMDIAAGEYGFTLGYFQNMLAAGAVDVLQADVTRCSGITGLLQAATLCQAAHLPFSAHCAPALHVHPCCAVIPLRHLEYFHDHVRIERMFFDGLPTQRGGELHPDFSRPGNGLEFKHADAKSYAV